jgi:hypothetical protein
LTINIEKNEELNNIEAEEFSVQLEKEEKETSNEEYFRPQTNKGIN